MQRRYQALMKYWEIIADHLSKAGCTWRMSSQIDLAGRMLFTADAHRSDGRRFVVWSDEKLTAFFELERLGCQSKHQSDPRPTGQRLLRRADSSIRYTADFLPLTINASAGKLIVPLTKYLRAASATACFMVGS